MVRHKLESEKLEMSLKFTKMTGISRSCLVEASCLLLF